MSHLSTGIWDIRADFSELRAENAQLLRTVQMMVKHLSVAEARQMLANEEHKSRLEDSMGFHTPLISKELIVLQPSNYYFPAESRSTSGLPEPAWSKLPQKVTTLILYDLYFAKLDKLLHLLTFLKVSQRSSSYQNFTLAEVKESSLSPCISTSALSSESKTE